MSVLTSACPLPRNSTHRVTPRFVPARTGNRRPSHKNRLGSEATFAEPSGPCDERGGVPVPYLICTRDRLRAPAV